MSEEQRAQVEEPTAEMREIFGVSFSAAEHFAQMLAEEGELRGLVGPRELPRLWSRHIVNSAAVVPFLPARGSVADVGSGAGFPGIVVALLRPDLDVTLIETMERRTQWLSDVVAAAGLVSESEGAEPHRYVVVLPADEEGVDEADDTENAADDSASEQA